MDTRDTIATQESTSEISLNSSFSSPTCAEGEASNVQNAPSHQTETETKAEEYASEMKNEMKGEVDQAKDIFSTTSNTISNEVGCYNNYYIYMCVNTTTIIDV